MQNNETHTYYGLFVQYNDSQEFLTETRKGNASFRPLDFKYIVQLAYPIVFVEVEVLERTMEDFPLVEKTVLKFIKDGIFDPAVIARTLGLTESYIRKIIKLLYGYGHMNNNGITPLGAESIRQDASIKMNTVRQRIQVDGVTAEPIYIKEFVSDQTLKTPKESGLFIAHMEPVEGVEKSRLIQYITEDYTDYVDKGEYSLHTNVERVNYAKFIDLRYAKAYYLQDDAGNMLIMCKTYDSTTKDLNDRFGWRPLYASSGDIAAKYGFDPQIARKRGFVNAAFIELRDRLEEKRSKTDEEVREMIGQLYPFNWEKTTLVRGDQTAMTVTKDSFTQYDRFVLKVLESIADDGYDNIILAKMFGERISVHTEDAELLKIAKEYKKAVENAGRQSIMNAMEKRSEKGIADIFRTLRKVMSEAEESAEEEKQ